MAFASEVRIKDGEAEVAVPIREVRGPGWSQTDKDNRERRVARAILDAVDRYLDSGPHAVLAVVAMMIDELDMWECWEGREAHVKRLSLAAAAFGFGSAAAEQALAALMREGLVSQDETV